MTPPFTGDRIILNDLGFYGFEPSRRANLSGGEI